VIISIYTLTKHVPRITFCERRLKAESNMSKPMFSEDEERRPLLCEEDLRDACLHAAATIVVTTMFGCEFEDCRLNDDGYKWPTSVSRTWLEYPKDWTSDAFPLVAMIHEAGSLAVTKRHGRPPHRINVGDGGARTADFLDDPLNWLRTRPN
jgi:hypothetical protein